MALEAVIQRSADKFGVERDTECYELEEITFDKPLIVLEDDRGVETFFTLCPTSIHASNDDVSLRLCYKLSIEHSWSRLLNESLFRLREYRLRCYG